MLPGVIWEENAKQMWLLEIILLVVSVFFIFFPKMVSKENSEQIRTVGIILLIFDVVLVIAFNLIKVF